MDRILHERSKNKKKLDPFQDMINRALQEQVRRIKILLWQKGITQVFISKRLKTSEQMISNVIHGKACPRHEEGIAKILGVPVERIFKRRQVMRSIERILR